DGIRDRTVTGVQTCALPIWNRAFRAPGALVALPQCPHIRLDLPPFLVPLRELGGERREVGGALPGGQFGGEHFLRFQQPRIEFRSEERRVGKEGRARRWGVR